jgi:glycine oxidase
MKSFALSNNPQAISMIDTAIIGGGVIGLSLAWELTQRGHRVVVVERGVPLDSQSATSSETTYCTSWTAAGILPPANFSLATDPLDQMRGFSHQLWPDYALGLKAISGIDVGLIRCGGYYLAETAGEAAAMIGMKGYWQELDIECQPISQTQLAERLPQLSHWIASNPWMNEHPDASAWWLPDEYQIRPSRLVKALEIACQRSGVEFIYETTVAGIEESDETVSLYDDEDVAAANMIATAQHAVLCGGAATGTIAAATRLERALIPIRGQILLLQCDEFQSPEVINIGNRYLVCRGDGLVLVGSCEEEAGFVQHPTSQMIEQLRQFATHVCPALAVAPEISCWAGLRPMTFDGFPMLGALPGNQRTFVAAGHYRSGIHFTPGTAIAMADTIEHKKTFMDLSPFSVGKQQTRA